MFKNANIYIYITKRKANTAQIDSENLPSSKAKKFNILCFQNN